MSPELECKMARLGGLCLSLHVQNMAGKISFFPILFVQMALMTKISMTNFKNKSLSTEKMMLSKVIGN